MTKDMLTTLMRDMGLTVQKWLDERLGPLEERLQTLEQKEPVHGKDGAPGNDGVDGKDGEPGKDGAPGKDGVDGKDGDPGKDGKDGDPGRDGRDGKDGRDGLDALDVSVLPAIDEAKSYPRGTWASHRGGLWVARKATDGLEGWECIVVGVAGAEIEFKGDRDLECAIELSDGSRTVRGTIVPVVIDRGVYRPGMEAKAGDAVSFGGSLWVAQKDTDEKPGEPDSGWRLAVKKGRDGKDGKDGRDGLDGLHGKSWTGKRVEE